MPANDIKIHAEIIAEKVSDLVNQKTNDNDESKIYLPEPLLTACHHSAGSLAILSYKPYLEEEFWSKTHARMFFLVLIISGYHTYCQERSLITNNSPYTYLLDVGEVNEIRKRVFDIFTSSNLKASPLGDRAMKLLIKKIKENLDFDYFILKGYELQKKSLNALIVIAFYMGYNFAKETIVVQ